MANQTFIAPVEPFITISPNPVTESGGVRSFTIRLEETAGGGTRLTSSLELKLGGVLRFAGGLAAAQAQRSLGNFKIGWEKQPLPIVRALGDGLRVGSAGGEEGEEGHGGSVPEVGAPGPRADARPARGCRGRVPAQGQRPGQREGPG